MKFVPVLLSTVAVIATVIACSGGDSETAPCPVAEPARSITGIADVEAGTLREQRFGVAADGSGGEVYLVFYPNLDGMRIDESDLALRVNYLIASDSASVIEKRDWWPAVISTAHATTCLAPVSQVIAALVDIEISPLASGSTPVFFEQAYYPGGGEYQVLNPGAGVDAETYLQRATNGPIDSSLVVDLRSSPVVDNTTEVYVSVTLDSGGVYMGSAGLGLAQ